MAVASKYEGVLVGYNSYVSKDKPVHTYYALIAQSEDKETGLYSECELARIAEDSAVIDKPKYGMRVEFYGSNLPGANGKTYVRYSNIKSV